MKILVTGREGQVVQSLLEKAVQRPDLDVIALGRPELDLAKPGTVHGAIAAIKPDLVVSAAAYTAVDLAEDEKALAFAANAAGAQAVAELRRPAVLLSSICRLIMFLRATLTNRTLNRMLPDLAVFMEAPSLKASVWLHNPIRNTSLCERRGSIAPLARISSRRC
jgi:hypothetical protein